ncbi:hypothetical protein [Streptomyces sp. A1136]|uniref:hypothetical protein n=1 Tax=Streptomyces sp. A1136 TaxID=2563102 RepID=UPI001F0DD984|nr:hypothetical protein [Streptomyces sp. A1136]
MSERRLIAYVHVDGETYGPDDKVPTAVAARIGEHAWAKDTEDTELPDGGGDESGPPPRSGRGSGRDAWAAYAEANGYAAGESTREQIIADLEAGGVIEREE